MYKIKSKIYLIILLLVLISSNVFAQTYGDSNGTLSFLNIPLGTRAIAMGNTFVSIADDPETVFINPAGVINLKLNAISIHANSKLDGMYNGYLAVALPPLNNELVGIGFGVMGLGLFDNAEGYDYTGTALSDITSYNLAAYLSFAFKTLDVEESDSFGFSIKGIYSIIDDSTNNFGIGLDVGGIFNIIAVKVGISIKDILTVFKSNNRNYIEFVEPRALIGISYNSKDLDGLVEANIAIQIDKPLLTDNVYFSLGGFYRLWKHEVSSMKDIINDDDNVNIDNIFDDGSGNGSKEDTDNISSRDDNFFYTQLYVLAGYDLEKLSFGLSFTFDPINMKIDIATQFPTNQNQNFGIFFTLELYI